MMYADMVCKCEEVYQPEHLYKFTGPCIVTGKSVTVSVKGAELYAYRCGAKIQDAMPSLSVDDREFLKSGYSKEGWDADFKEETEEVKEGEGELMSQLCTLITTHAQAVGTDLRGSLRDVLTELIHAAKIWDFDFDQVLLGAMEVYEEKTDGDEETEGDRSKDGVQLQGDGG